MKGMRAVTSPNRGDKKDKEKKEKKEKKKERKGQDKDEEVCSRFLCCPMGEPCLERTAGLCSAEASSTNHRTNGRPVFCRLTKHTLL